MRSSLSHTQNVLLLINNAGERKLKIQHAAMKAMEKHRAVHTRQHTRVRVKTQHKNIWVTLPADCNVYAQTPCIISTTRGHISSHFLLVELLELLKHCCKSWKRWILLLYELLNQLPYFPSRMPPGNGRKNQEGKGKRILHDMTDFTATPHPAGSQRAEEVEPAGLNCMRLRSFGDLCVELLPLWMQTHVRHKHGGIGNVVVFTMTIYRVHFSDCVTVQLEYWVPTSQDNLQ